MERRNRKNNFEGPNLCENDVGNELLETATILDENKEEEKELVIKGRKEGKKVYMRVPLMSKVMEKLEIFEGKEPPLKYGKKQQQKKRPHLTRAQVELIEVMVHSINYKIY